MHDPAWLDLVPGVPTWTGDGALLTVEVSDDTDRLLVFLVSHASAICGVIVAISVLMSGLGSFFSMWFPISDF